MRRKLWKLSWLPAMFAALLIAACDQSPVSTDVPLAPDGEVLFAQEGVQSGWSKVEGTIGAFSVRGEIGPEGGVIRDGNFELRVPRGAVRGPTVFVMESRGTGYVEVSLTATAVGSPDTNDVGREGFSKPVELHVSYHPSGGVVEWQKYRIGWVTESGAISPMKTRLYVGQTFKAVGYIPHFSDYALIYPL